MKSIHIKYL